MKKKVLKGEIRERIFRKPNLDPVHVSIHRSEVSLYWLVNLVNVRKSSLHVVCTDLI